LQSNIHAHIYIYRVKKGASEMLEMSNFFGIYFEIVLL